MSVEETTVVRPPMAYDLAECSAHISDVAVTAYIGTVRQAASDPESYDEAAVDRQTDLLRLVVETLHGILLLMRAGTTGQQVASITHVTGLLGRWEEAMDKHGLLESEDGTVLRNKLRTLQGGHAPSVAHTA